MPDPARPIHRSPLPSPFVYFGGKSRVAPEVWKRFGDVPSYVEPFFGSGAVLLSRPHEAHLESVNDMDGLLANFWRAVQADPEAVAHHADWPVNECDLHARHLWLVARKEDIQSRMCADPDFFDAKAAGWWVWGINLWIGGGWCSGKGPWQNVDGVLTRVDSEDGVKRQLPHLGDNGNGVHRKLPHLGNNGKGVHRQLPHLGDNGKGVHRQLPHLGDNGNGVHRKLPHLGSSGAGVHSGKNPILPWMMALSERLRRVRVCCGDWSRVCGPSVTIAHGMTAVFLDPPYSDEAGRCNTLYSHESGTVAHDVREWCAEWGDHKLMRICLAGYVGEHEQLADLGWTPYFWRAPGGYAGQGSADSRGVENAKREVLWFSPHCLRDRRTHTEQLDLFEDVS